MYILLVILSINGYPSSTQSYFQNKTSCEVEANRLSEKSGLLKQVNTLCIYSPSFK